MRVVIIEDELPAIEKLEMLLIKYDPSIKVVKSLTDVRSGVAWLRANENAYDLIFSDIVLTDGTSFDIFSEVAVAAPVILITAFDQYALEAFRVNSIDYLLKPLTYEGLCASMEKVARLKDQFSGTVPLDELQQIISYMNRKYKERFMVKIGDHIRSVRTEHIDMFHAEGRTVYLLSQDKKRYIVDYKLEALESMLDPVEFFRVNRSVILNINAISDVIVYSNSRLKILPSFPYDKEIIVSREKVGLFKTWLEGR